MVGKRLACLFLVLSILVGCTAVSVVSSAVSYGEAGVRAGQWAEYTAVTGYGNGTVRYRIEVTGVVGSIVHFNWTIFVGDQVHEYQWTENLSSGSFWMFLVMPNLGTGDPLWPGSDLRINGTMTMLAMGYERSVAYIEVRFYDYFSRRWYDVETGLSVKSETWNKWGCWENLTLTSSNVFGSQSSSHGDSVLDAVVVVLAVAAVAVVFSGAGVDASRRRR